MSPSRLVATTAFLTASSLLFDVGVASALPLYVGAPLAAMPGQEFVDQVHGFHCRPLWGPTPRGWRFHNHPAACDWDHDNDLQFRLHLRIWPHLQLDLDGHPH
jgi:hypothetical protein